MKRIISIVTAVCASIALFTACSKDNSITELDGLHVSSSYVSIAEKGGNRNHHTPCGGRLETRKGDHQKE